MAPRTSSESLLDLDETHRCHCTFDTPPDLLPPPTVTPSPRLGELPPSPSLVCHTEHPWPRRRAAAKLPRARSHHKATPTATRQSRRPNIKLPCTHQGTLLASRPCVAVGISSEVPVHGTFHSALGLCRMRPDGEPHSDSQRRALTSNLHVV